jgi:integrase
LKPSGTPYYAAIGEKGLSLGYRRLATGPGTWLVRTRSGGAYHHTGIGTADDVADSDNMTIFDFWQAVERARAKASGGGVVAARGARDLTVADVMADYVRMLEGEGRGEHNLRDAQSRIRVHILPTLGNVRVSELTPDRLRSWRDDLAKSPRRRGKTSSDDAARSRRATSNRTLAILRAALNRAFHDGKVESDVAWRKVKLFKAVDASRASFLTVAECTRLINTCEPDFRALVQAALYSGCRYGELIALRVADYHSDSGTLAIRKSKSGKPRHVVLNDEGQGFFAQLCAGRDGGESILRKANGSAWIRGDQYRPMLAAVTRAKISPKISFHGLRHTWASLAAMNGIPLLIVARNLGHSSTRMCEKHYSHLAPSYVSDAIRKHAPSFGFKPGKVTALR